MLSRPRPPPLPSTCFSSTASTSIRTMKKIIATLLLLSTFSGSLFSLNDGNASDSKKENIACNSTRFYNSWTYLIEHTYCSEDLTDAMDQLGSVLEVINKPYPASSAAYLYFQCAMWDCVPLSVCHLYEYVDTPFTDAGIDVYYLSTTKEWCAEAQLWSRRGVGCLPCGESLPSGYHITVWDSLLAF